MGWCNYHLRERAMKIESLETDLSDGLILINLVEILTKKAIDKYVKKPKNILHKINNNALALGAIAEAGAVTSGCSAEGNFLSAFESHN
jgi:hypothetical protein